MPYKDPSKQKLAVENWFKQRPDYLRNKLRTYRKEGRISKNGIKYEHNEFYSFKGNPRFGQKLAKELYFAEGQEAFRSTLESQGINLQTSPKPFLELKHTCTEQCSFFGHVESWVTIEPVAYKIHFVNSSMSQEEHKYVTKIVKTERGERWISELNPKFKQAYWIFKRYLKKERKLDFPTVRPIIKCEKCNVTVELNSIDDMFTFKHECIDPNTIPRFFWFVKGKRIIGSKEGWSLNDLHRFIGKTLPTTGFGFSITDCVSSTDDPFNILEKEELEGE